MSTNSQLEPLEVQTVKFNRTRAQAYRQGSELRIVRFQGNCILCGTRTYGHDDGQDDPRGILGDHANASLVADEYDMAGPDVPACFLCQNDTEEKYKRLLARAMRRWVPLAPEVVAERKAAIARRLAEFDAKNSN